MTDTSLKNFIFTSESVSEGHPDKICDQISDAIVDAFLEQDPMSRLAVECLATTNRVVVGGEFRSTADITEGQIMDITRDVIREIGYEQGGFHWQKADIEILLHGQSVDIAQGVDSDGNEKDEGAGDQGIMFGYACNETDALMPAAIYYSHRILQSLSDSWKAKEIALGPDAKSQVSLQYQDGKPIGAETVLVSCQHPEEAKQEDIREIIRKHAEKVLPEGWMCKDDKLFTNPTGRFVIGGPDSDCGLTGRKIIVDTYGGAAPHGGGAFSGKDPTKVDRSAAYVARYLAKNVVAAELAERCTIQLAYAIGVSKPLAVYVNTHGTGKVDEVKLSEKLQSLVDLTPRGIREHLQLNKPIYRRTAAYGHFGRTPSDDGGFSWEKTDIANRL